jgi:hypothetical protein
MGLDDHQGNCCNRPGGETNRYVDNNKKTFAWLRPRADQKTANFHALQKPPSQRPIERGLSRFLERRFAVPLVRAR